MSAPLSASAAPEAAALKPGEMSDAELAAHLADCAGRILLEVRASGLFSPKALGKAGDQTANQFLIHAIREARPRRRPALGGEPVRRGEAGQVAGVDRRPGRWNS